MLVPIAAWPFIIDGAQLLGIAFLASGNQQGKLRMNPLRQIEAGTVGIAFLAAGLIFTSGGKVKNITTGASLVLCGVIGLACGAGQIPLPVMATAIVVVVVGLIGRIENKRPGE